jgi:hypothetical protein
MEKVTLAKILEDIKAYLKTMRPGVDKARMQRVIKQIEVVKENEGK